MGMIALIRSIQSRIGLGVLLAGLFLPLLQPVSAQIRTGIPTIAEADSLFSIGLAHFRAGNNEAARTAFEQVLDGFTDNASTSTARIMAAKAAYRDKDYISARAFLSAYASDFPTSSYLQDARELDSMALAASRQQSLPPVRLGILLSLSEEDRVPSQALFNGIRLAVDEHNLRDGARPVIMMFRNIEGDPNVAADAVSDLSRAGADIIIGTMYSEEAIAAAERADEEEVIFIAPLATDERVSSGRRYAFQANPSMTARGEAMARFAVNGLRLTRLGVFTVADERRIGERLSDGFIQTASELGAEINLIQLLPSESAWFDLPVNMPADTLDLVDAIYVPMATRDAPALAGAILGTFDRFRKNVRLLGNNAWHDLPQKAHASRYTMSYSNDFLPDLSSNDFLRFAWTYFDLNGSDVDRLGLSGFDVTRFALEAASREDSRALWDVLRNMPEYQGYGLRIHFDGGNVNRAFYYHRYRDGALTLLR